MMTPEDYRENIQAVIQSARHMRAADPARPSRAWFTFKYDPARAPENETLYDFAATLGYDLSETGPAGLRGEAGGAQTQNSAEPAPALPASAPDIPLGKKVPRRMMNFLSRDQLFVRPDPQWLVRDLLIEGAFTILYAQSKSFKSYLALNIAAQLATGGEFFPDQPLRRRGVVNIVLEGGHGMKSRIDAWETYHGKRLDARWFRQVEDWQNFLDPEEVQNLVDNLHVLVAEGFDLGMVIIDTASKALGGGDTLSHADTCKFCESCIRIQSEFGCSVLLIHHTGKDEDGGIIGSNAWLTQPDAVIKVERPDKTSLAVTAIVEKQKAAADGQRHKLMARLVDLDTEIGGYLVLLPDGDAGQVKRLQAMKREADDVYELITTMGAAERMSMNKLCLMSKAKYGRFRVVNSATYDMIRRVVPKGRDQARVVVISEGETAAIWRDEDDYICKQSGSSRLC